MRPWQATGHDATVRYLASSEECPIAEAVSEEAPVTSTTRVSRHINAQPAQVYAALVDAAAVAQWRFPRGTNIRVHEFAGRVGGRLRISLTYRAADQVGKTTSHTDTYRAASWSLIRTRASARSTSSRPTTPPCAERSPPPSPSPLRTTAGRSSHHSPRRHSRRRPEGSMTGDRPMCSQQQSSAPEDPASYT
jgi:hypothetical protein